MQHVLPDTWTGAEWWIQVLICPRFYSLSWHKPMSHLCEDPALMRILENSPQHMIAFSPAPSVTEPLPWTAHACIIVI